MLRNMIGGRWEDAASGETDPVLDPATGSRHAEAASSGATDVDRAVGAATEAEHTQIKHVMAALA